MHLCIYLSVLIDLNLYLSFKYIEYLKAANFNSYSNSYKKINFTNFKESAFTGIVDLSSMQSTEIC